MAWALRPRSSVASVVTPLMGAMGCSIAASAAFKSKALRCGMYDGLRSRSRCSSTSRARIVAICAATRALCSSRSSWFATTRRKVASSAGAMMCMMVFSIYARSERVRLFATGSGRGCGDSRRRLRVTCPLYSAWIRVAALFLSRTACQRMNSRRASSQRHAH
eukprot:Amastigsp_a175750_5.p3 type:complete len:163 gc:universal Amastigsp_a175750_5:526-38(-)